MDITITISNEELSNSDKKLIKKCLDLTTDSELNTGKCWYISPSSWDTNRFSKGAANTTLFEITTNDSMD